MAAKKLNKTNVPNLRFKEFDGDWEEDTLGNLCSNFKAGSGITSESIFDEGEYPVYGGNGLRGYTDKFNYEGNFVLIGRQGALCGNINYIRGKSYVSEHAIVIGGTDISDIKWLNYKLFLMKLGRLSESSAQPGLSVEKLKKLKTVIPKSLKEQQKIAAFLSLIDERISTQIKIIEELRLLKSALSKKIFTQQLRFKANNNFHDWEKVQIGNLVDDIHSGKNKTELHGNFSIYGSMGIIGYSTSYSYEGEYILVARVGANAGSIQLASGKFSVSDNTLVFYGLKGVDTLFFYHLLIELKLNRLAFGSGQPLITGGQLKRLVVFIPTQEEQIKIGNFLSTIDKKLDAERVLLQQLEKQKQYLLQNLFI
jgi:type I restriction enzyme S subunit